LGEHTQEVLEQAGFTAQEIESLKEQGAFAA
jgi:crotonobetainyl-CoA:carnitine CoA-transferase CaiB-like acyl-CoA transferase